MELDTEKLLASDAGFVVCATTGAIPIIFGTTSYGLYLYCTRCTLAYSLQSPSLLSICPFRVSNNKVGFHFLLLEAFLYDKTFK